MDGKAAESPVKVLNLDGMSQDAKIIKRFDTFLIPERIEGK
jgi:hypothetical protein